MCRSRNSDRPTNFSLYKLGLNAITIWPIVSPTPFAAILSDIRVYNWSDVLKDEVFKLYEREAVKFDWECANRSRCPIYRKKYMENREECCLCFFSGSHETEICVTQNRLRSTEKSNNIDKFYIKLINDLEFNHGYYYITNHTKHGIATIENFIEVLDPIAKEVNNFSRPNSKILLEARVLNNDILKGLFKKNFHLRVWNPKFYRYLTDKELKKIKRELKFKKKAEKKEREKRKKQQEFEEKKENVKKIPRPRSERKNLGTNRRKKGKKKKKSVPKKTEILVEN